MPIRSAIESFSRRKRDWTAALANLRYLHDATEGQPDVHETVHDLARDLGAEEDWLHWLHS